VQALVLRAAVAVNLDDKALARTVLSKVRQMPLEAHDRDTLSAELQRADDLEQMLV
jgi:hypothetical protein